MSELDGEEMTFVIIQSTDKTNDINSRVRELARREGLTFDCGIVLNREALKNRMRRQFDEHASEPHFEDLIKTMTSGSVKISIWRGEDAIGKMCNILEGLEGALHAALLIAPHYYPIVPRVAYYSSNSKEDAERDITLWNEVDDL